MDNEAHFRKKFANMKPQRVRFLTDSRTNVLHSRRFGIKL